MPKVLMCVFCAEEIEAKEKWLDVPGRMNEAAQSEMLEGEQSSGGPQSQHLMLLVNQGDATLADFTRVAAITQLHENH
jgi:hypothetical protein